MICRGGGRYWFKKMESLCVQRTLQDLSKSKQACFQRLRGKLRRGEVIESRISWHAKAKNKLYQLSQICETLRIARDGDHGRFVLFDVQRESKKPARGNGKFDAVERKQNLVQVGGIILPACSRLRFTCVHKVEIEDTADKRQSR